MIQITPKAPQDELKSHDAYPDLDSFSPKYIKVREYDVRYARFVRKNAPTLVLLNGFPQSIRMWESAWEALSQNFDILAFDIPGFGLSNANEKDMSPRQLSRIIVEVFDHFDLEKAHLVGPDVGVPIALATAIEYPNRLESINIFDGPGTYPPKMSPILNAVIKSRFVRWLAKGINKKLVMKTNFNVASKDGYHRYQPTEDAIKEYYSITHNDQSHQRAINFFSSYSKDLPWIQQQLQKISTPVLITWGKLDPFVLVSNAHDLSKNIPLNKCVIFENASHFSSEDAGDKYLEVLTHWCLSEYKQLSNDM